MVDLNSSFFFSRVTVAHVLTMCPGMRGIRSLVMVIQHYEDDRKQEILEMYCKQRANRRVLMDCLV